MAQNELRRPYPIPNAETEFYWAAARNFELHIAQCRSCTHYIHPPRALCPRCWSEDIRPTRVSGRGTVYTFTVNEVGGRVPGWEHYPYLNVLVDLIEQPHLRIVANLIHFPVERNPIGIRVKVAFETLSPSLVLPQFEPEVGA